MDNLIDLTGYDSSDDEGNSPVLLRSPVVLSDLAQLEEALSSPITSKEGGDPGVKKESAAPPETPTSARGSLLDRLNLFSTPAPQQPALTTGEMTQWLHCALWLTRVQRRMQRPPLRLSACGSSSRRRARSRQAQCHLVLAKYRTPQSPRARRVSRPSRAASSLRPLCHARHSHPLSRLIRMPNAAPSRLHLLRLELRPRRPRKLARWSQLHLCSILSGRRMRHRPRLASADRRNSI